MNKSIDIWNNNRIKERLQDKKAVRQRCNKKIEKSDLQRKNHEKIDHRIDQISWKDQK